MLKKSDVLQTVVLSVDQNKKRVALGLKQLSRDPWELDIPNRYHVGGLIVGKITKLTNFGAFVELESDLEGLLHISEITDKRIKNPEEVVQVGQEVQCRIIKVDPNERKIGLSLLREGEETGVDLDEESGEGTGEIDSSAASEEATEADSAVEAEATTDAEPVEAAAETEVVAEADSGAETEVVAEADSGAETEDVAEAVVEEPVAVETEGEAEEDKKE
jgi:small subunit ribosomal protein S1